MTNLFLKKKIINHFSHVIISCLILVSAAVEQWNEEFHFTWMIISISVSLGLQPWQPSEQTEKWITIYKYLTKDVIESRLRPSHSTALSRDCYLLGCGWTSKCLLSCFTGGNPSNWCKHWQTWTERCGPSTLLATDRKTLCGNAVL